MRGDRINILSIRVCLCFKLPSARDKENRGEHRDAESFRPYSQSRTRDKPQNYISNIEKRSKINYPLATRKTDAKHEISVAISVCLLPIAFLLPTKRKAETKAQRLRDSPPAHNLRLGPASPPVPAPAPAPDPPAAPRPDSSAILRLRSRCCSYCGRPALLVGGARAAAYNRKC